MIFFLTKIQVEATKGTQAIFGPNNLEDQVKNREDPSKSHWYFFSFVP